MKPSIFIAVFLLGFLWTSAQACLECGEECKQLCGTKQFKACCFNYLKKRNVQPSPPDLKLEVSLADQMHRGILMPAAYDQYPLAALLARQARLSPLDRLRLVYDA